LTLDLQTIFILHLQYTGFTYLIHYLVSTVDVLFRLTFKTYLAFLFLAICYSDLS